MDGEMLIGVDQQIGQMYELREAIRKKEEDES